jgi:hypothetical protein
VQRLLAELDDDQFIKRERAMRQLQELAELVEPQLRQTLGSSPSLEVRRRVRQLLELLDPSAPTQWRQTRAIAALEHARTPTARRVLERLATGAKMARQTCAAQAALNRLNRRPRATRPERDDAANGASQEASTKRDITLKKRDQP